jgi:quercetin dioxygenase-like cupin family protein
LRCSTGATGALSCPAWTYCGFSTTIASTHRKWRNPVSTAQATVGIDDQQVRVTTWTFEGTGDATGRHVHEYDYIVVPVTGGRFTVVDSDGATREMTQDAGSPYRGTAGTSHNVINSTGARAVFVEIELKR